MRAIKTLLQVLRDERGATVIEYGFIVALVCLAIMTMLTDVADKNTGIWARFTEAVNEVM